MAYLFETDNPATKKLWEKGARLEAIKDTLFGKYSDTTGTNVIEVDNSMKKQAGDTKTFTLIYDLDDTKFVSGEETLEGNEEDMQPISQSVTLDNHAWAVNVGRLMEKQRSGINLKSKGETLIKRKLKAWIERKFFETLVGASTTETLCPDNYDSSIRTVYPTVGNASGHTTLNTLTAVDFINATQLSHARIMGLTGEYNKETGRSTYLKMPTLKHKGRSSYVAFVHTEVIEQMRLDATIRQELIDIGERGYENPIFSAADFIYNGIPFVGSDMIPIRYNANGIPIAMNVLVGAQAVLWTWGMGATTVHPYTKDAWGRQNFMGMEIVCEAARSQWEGKAFSVIGIPSTRIGVEGV